MQLKEYSFVSLFTLLTLVGSMSYQPSSNAQLGKAKILTQSIKNTPNLVSQAGSPFFNPAEVPDPIQIQPPQPPSFPQPPQPPSFPQPTFPSQPSFPHPQQDPLELNRQMRGRIQIRGIQPIEPIRPISPIEPIQPIRPISPIQPIEPIRPISPIEPIQPVGSLSPFDETQKRIRNVKLSRCAINRTISRIGPSNTSSVNGSSSRSENSSSTSFRVTFSHNGGSTTETTEWHSDWGTENSVLEETYALGESSFRNGDLEKAKLLITQVAQLLGVFSFEETAKLGEQSGSFFSDGNKTKFQVVTTSGRDSSESTTCLNNARNYTLEAKTFRLLEQIYLAQRNTDEALKVAEAGRTIEVDKNIAFNLIQGNSEKLSQVSKELSRGLTLNEIKQLSVDEKATIVSYSTTEIADTGKISIWVIRKGQIHYTTTDLNKIDLRQPFQMSAADDSDPDRKSKVLMRGIRESLKTSKEKLTPTERQKAKDQQTLQLMALYRLLIDPIQRWLPTDPNEHIVFVPHGVLFFVPFPALQNPTTGKYLVDEHTIRAVPNLRSLYISRQREHRHGRALVVGNPKTSQVNLEGAALEAATIAQFLETKQRSVDKFINEDVSKEQVLKKIRDAEIIHLATHGNLDTDSSGNDNTLKQFAGAIALSPQGNDNGLLTAPEILNLNLKADLVVLSACDTGRGPLTAGGVIGLPLSFSLARVPNVIVSLWAVRDTPTSKLMMEFYDQLLQDPNADKAKALRTAMLKIKGMPGYEDPINWAAFTLMGRR